MNHESAHTIQTDSTMHVPSDLYSSLDRRSPLPSTTGLPSSPSYAHKSPSCLDPPTSLTLTTLPSDLNSPDADPKASHGSLSGRLQITDDWLLGPCIQTTLPDSLRLLNRKPSSNSLVPSSPANGAPRSWIAVGTFFEEERVQTMSHTQGILLDPCSLTAKLSG